MSRIVSVHAARPPEEGLRRYHNPDPRTRSEDGVVGIFERYESVCEVFRYGSLRLVQLNSYTQLRHSHHQNSSSISASGCASSRLPPLNANFRLLKTNFRSECFSPSVSHPAGTPPYPLATSRTAAKKRSRTLESPMKRTCRLSRRSVA